MSKQDIIKFLRENGRKGGKAFVEKHGKEALSELGKKGAAARWKGHVKKTKKS